MQTKKPPPPCLWLICENDCETRASWWVPSLYLSFVVSGVSRYANLDRPTAVIYSLRDGIANLPSLLPCLLLPCLQRPSPSHQRNRKAYTGHLHQQQRAAQQASSQLSESTIGSSSLPFGCSPCTPCRARVGKTRTDLCTCGLRSNL